MSSAFHRLFAQTGTFVAGSRGEACKRTGEAANRAALFYSGVAVQAAGSKTTQASIFRHGRGIRPSLFLLRLEPNRLPRRPGDVPMFVFPLVRRLQQEVSRLQQVLQQQQQQMAFLRAEDQTLPKRSREPATASLALSS